MAKLGWYRPKYGAPGIASGFFIINFDVILNLFQNLVFE